MKDKKENSFVLAFDRFLFRKFFGQDFIFTKYPAMKNKTLFFLIFCFASLISNSQDIKFPALHGFKIKSNYPVYVRDNLWDFIDGAADTYLSYGFIDVHVAEYKKGKQVIKAEIYRHTDNTMAFGIYSSERSPSFHFVNIGTQGYIEDGVVNFFKGNYYVKIRTYSDKASVLHATETLAGEIASTLVGNTEMPAMLALFPQEGKKANEETYISESVLGHSFLSNAFKANYQAGNDNFSVYILEDTAPEASRKTVEDYCAATGIDVVDAGDGKYVLSDGYNGKIFLAWKNNIIVIISGLAKDQADIANKYSSEILK